MQWVHRITSALEQGRFKLFYQTIVSLDDHEDSTFSSELLVRMIGQDGKLIPPMAFIPAAERYNLMASIDRWVVVNALTTLGAARQQISACNCRFSINLSAHSLSEDKFLDFLEQQFGLHDIEPDNFCFEVTETAAISNITAARKFMTRLREMGCRFSLDDFGSGLSSFEYLRNLPVDYLKIDGAFVRNISNDPIDKAMVQSINQVGHVMGISTIAEFVEDDRTLKLLKQIGINYAQGFAIAKPRPLEELACLLEQGSALSGKQIS
jgi:EAL domain-containing protein (putative c-di-GMP-specific phosphodiesterase class I)